MVLLKGFDADGFVFYTNLGSTKGRELAANPKAALLFHWKSLRRQVRVRGAVTPVTDAEADAYFATRPRLARIGAWASKQSQPIESRLALEKAVALDTAKYAVGEVPRPPHWSGFRIAPAGDRVLARRRLPSASPRFASRRRRGQLVEGDAPAVTQDGAQGGMSGDFAEARNGWSKSS